jgi:hypothetical protein
MNLLSEYVVCIKFHSVLSKGNNSPLAIWVGDIIPYSYIHLSRSCLASSEGREWLYNSSHCKDYNIKPFALLVGKLLEGKYWNISYPPLCIID